MLDNVEIDIDFWPQIPTYVEFESDCEENIKCLCEKLDIDFGKLVTINVSAIYSQYGIDIKKFPILKLEENRKVK